jgi:replicative DNA helicase
VTALSSKRLAIDVKAVAALAHAMGLPIESVYGIACEVTTPAHTLAAAKHVLAASQLRALTVACSDAAQVTGQSGIDPELVSRMVETLRAQIGDIENRAIGGGPVQVTDAYPDLLKRIDANEPIPQGVPTGFYDLDKYLNGLRDGEMIVLAARPSVGKTLFAMNILENIAEREDSSAVLFFSMEMGADALYQRMMFGRAGVNTREAMRGNASADEKERLHEAHNEMKRMRLKIHAESAITPQRLYSIARRFQAKHGHTVIAIDYLGLMRGEGGSIYEQVTSLSKAIKNIGQDLRAPMLTLCQLSRNAAEERPKPGQAQKPPEVRIPVLADLRDSGSIEQDADAVIFLARDILQRDPHRADMLLSKHRAGLTGKAEVLFDTTGPRFRNIARVERFDGKSL